MHAPVERCRHRDRTWPANAPGYWHWCLEANATSEYVRETNAAPYVEPFQIAPAGPAASTSKWIEVDGCGANSNASTLSIEGISACETISSRQAIRSVANACQDLHFSLRLGGWLSSTRVRRLRIWQQDRHPCSRSLR